MNHHSLHPDQVTSQTQTPTQTPTHPSDREVAHPKGEGEEGGGEEEEEEGGGEGEGEGREEAVDQEAEVVYREIRWNHITFYKSMQWVITM